MPQHVVTTALEETWPKDRPLIFLGEWCRLLERKAVWQEKDAKLAPFLWDSVDSITQGIELLAPIREKTLLALQETLNQTLRIRKTTDYYQRLLGPWLLSFVDQLYDKYLSLSTLLTSKQQLSTSVLAEQQHVVPAAYSCYLDWVVDSDVYAYQIYSDIVKFLDIPHEVYHCNSPLQQASEYRYVSRRTEWIHKALQLLSQPSFPFQASTPEIVVVQAGLRASNLRQRRVLSKALPGKARIDDLQYSCRTQTILDRNLRDSIQPAIGDTPFEKLLSRTLFRHLPLLYLEGYHGFRERALRHYPQAPKLFFSANALSSNSVFRFISAEYLSQSKLLYMQHGGAYGTERIHTGENLERETSDAFLTYGWGEDQQTSSLPHPRFAPLSVPRKIPQKPQRVVFLSNCFPRYVFRLQFKPQANAVIGSYLSQSIAILNSLPKDYPLHLRCYPGSDFAWKIPQRIRESGISFPLSEKHSLEEEIESSDLLIIDHLGTSYLEALSKNIPTILVSSTKYFSPRESAAKYFDALSNCGILHFDAASAVMQIQLVSQGLRTWWQSDDVQTARIAFANRFARYESDWASLWSECISSQLQSSKDLVNQLPLSQAPREAKANQ